MKKALDQYIADLLYRYDLVTVPGFGTFVAKRHPAYYEQSKEMFFPPYKAITFNARLRDDDGTLIDAVARGENIDRHTAKHLIIRSVEWWQNQINRYGRLYLENLGAFSLNGDKAVFTPLPQLNLLPEAFGLHPVLRAPLPREESRAEIPAPASVVSEPDRKTQATYKEIRFPEPERSASQLRISRPWIGAAAALLLGGWGLWFWHTHPGLFTRTGPQPYQAGYSLTESLPVIRISGPAAKTTEENTFNVRSGSGKNYLLIAGAFRSAANARKMLQNLKQQFPEARLAGRNARGLYLVAAGAASDRENARRLKGRLQNLGLQTWILDPDK